MVQGTMNIEHESSEAIRYIRLRFSFFSLASLFDSFLFHVFTSEMSGDVVSIDIFFMHRSPLFIHHSLNRIESFESILSRSNENGSPLNRTKI